MPALRVLVTRPQPQADEWVARLRAAGFDAVALPLLHIAEAPQPPLRAAWADIAAAAVHALVFVSPNAVSRFFAARPPGTHWPAQVWAAAPGPGTAQALMDAGVPAASVLQPAADSQSFDSESLWQRMGALPWSGRRVRVVRGEGGRDWLAQRLQEAGAQVGFLQAYGRGAPAPHAAQAALIADALAHPDNFIWLFSSSEAVGYLPALAPAGADWSGARALASHPRIAQAARDVGFAQVAGVPPAFDAVCAALRDAERPLQHPPRP
ncbi:uroporphyrinogen-III synthase [Azohydromonas lata]|uniref:Uroporphyrinogen-III synthase n=1 Tax=Azohydromonas lata TaxID=45677 RepID=A0ABU5IGM0_9BURK|nr:uroporphyrinogen-III synthase [Azohydromonas lata]MDZ5457685.1 uroporphyrinogen-III synthase [Azohydromonas lata]